MCARLAVFSCLCAGLVAAPTPALGVDDWPVDGWIDDDWIPGDWSGPPANGYWSLGKPRWFVSARPEVGTPYAKPYVSLGYGMPHWLWVGVDANAIITLEMAQAYGGARIATPIIDVAFALRDTWSFEKGFPVPGTRLTRDDVFDAPGRKARYLAWEGEAVGVLPLPYSGLVASLIVVRTLDVPRDRYLYDESYRAVVAKPLFLTLRLAAVARFGPERAIRVGVLGEHIFETGRPKGVFRVGPVSSFQLTDHLELLAGVTFGVSSPDALGLSLATYGVAGLRYRWASDEERPEVPWEGRWIPW